ncbi:hypothetical protein [Chryseobacterium binzhouense]|uniref:hypothetical protein n=1 Tax=Chryseobacterium binzhouense TaxID=2593646 RepID=UPI0028999198|nr:hypothetical protein [Chryseobacterium binzhouense]
MKKIILFFMLFPVLAFSQSDSLDLSYLDISEKYNSTYKFYKEYIQPDANVERLISALEEFKPTYEKILRLDNLKNKNVQNALISEYANKYGDLFIHTVNKRKVTYLFTSFDNKSDVYDYINKGAYMLKMDIHNRMFALIKKDFEKMQIYINQNLKRFGISREDYEKMSQNDKDELWELFR